MGVEVGEELDILRFIEIGFLDQLELFANYTYENARFNKGANDDKFIPMAPQYQVSTGMRTKFLKYYNASLVARFVGARFAINDVLNETANEKPYFVVDSKIGFENDPLEVYLAVNNMFNELYETFTTKSTFSSTKSHFPAPERNFTVGVNVKF